METENQTFWEHLDVLRTMLIKIVVITILFGVVAFLFKDELFAIVLAPKESEFVTYRLFRRLNMLGAAGDAPASFYVKLVNTGLAEQFIIHMQTAVSAGVLCASPYILYLLFCFVSPALYSNERKYALGIVGSGYFMFMIGILVSYFLIFPFTFRFLGTYQVSSEVENMITLQSYMSTLIMMCLAMGFVFEMPVLAWLFAKFGFISSASMRRYRKHAYVVILIAAAIITPTSDIFTLLLVSLPMFLLYEISIFITKATLTVSTL